VEPEVVVIPNNEEEEPMEVEVKPPTPTNAPASTPVAIPIPPVDAPVPAATPAPTLSVASASTPVPPSVAPEVQKEMGWTTRNKFKDAHEDTHYHNLYTTMLAEYYPELAATVKYYCAEHKHPMEATYWKTNVIITAWNNTDNSHDVETTHSHRSRRANVHESIEDAAQEAYLYYHGHRFEAMQENRYRFLPRYDHAKRTWAVLVPSVTDPTMDTTVRHLYAMDEANEALKEEFRAAQKSEKRLQKQIDDLAT
jgi:hypothetical protein